MLQVVAGRRAAVSLTAIALVLTPAAALGQAADPLDQVDRPLDPSAPLEPWPEVELPWPELGEEDAGIPDLPERLADAAAQRSYSVRIEGLDAAGSAALIEQFRARSALEEHGGAPANAAQVDRRARADAALIAELLRAHGHYDAAVDTRVEAGADGLLVTLEVRPGPLYRFVEVQLPGIEAAGEDAAALRDAFAVGPEDPVDAAAVEAAQAALAAELGRRGYAFAELGAPDILIDHADRSARLVLPVRPQGTRRFGRVVVEGDAPFGAGHVETIARFEEGDPWSVAMVDDLRRALVATGLISSVTIRPVAREGSDLVDLAVAIDPAPMRTIAGEAGYGTGEGVRVELSWQHRNLLPPEGAVTFRGVLGTREQQLSATLRRSNFLERDQVLTGQVAAAHIDRPAYDARTFLLAGGIERQTNLVWQKAWTWSVGAELVASDERDVDLDSGMTRRRTFFIAALPAFLGYDGSNDLLDPTRGFRLAGRLSPEASLQSGGFGYARAQIDASVYFPVSDTVTLAARTRLGTIVGASRDRIAPSRRFYAGGGGSVRGYGFQALGPRDPVFDDPIGGRSLAEFAIEARIRVGDFGIVPFLDAGNLSTDPLPAFDDLRFGAGIGVRYHTRFGPIRIDVGTPIDPREGDAPIAVYVSLGQAF